MQQNLIVMQNKSILMPHICQKIGWWLLLLTILVVVSKIILTNTIHDITVAWYMAKTSYILLIISLLLITLSKEKVEDEMISDLRLKALGVTAYAFFVLLLILGLILDFSEQFSPYLGELVLIVLPFLTAGLYLLLFKGMLLRSKKEQSL